MFVRFLLVKTRTCDFFSHAIFFQRVVSGRKAKNCFMGSVSIASPTRRSREEMAGNGLDKDWT